MKNVIKDKKLKKFTSKMQANLLLVFCILIVAMLGLIFRLVQINRTDGERYSKRVLSQQTYTDAVIPYKRGSILDRKGTVLATSEKVYNIILDVKFMLEDEKYQAPTTKALTECYKDITDKTISEIVEKKPDSRYVVLEKGISYDEMMKFKNMEDKNENIQGVWFEEDYVRKYPYSTLACDVLGFTSSGNVGNWGIEQYYNDELNGTNGIEYGYIDSELKLERTTQPAIDGNDIITTIDANVQEIVQNHIKTYNEEFGSKNIGVLVMNPNNGEILAMASNEEYDLNNPADLTPFYSDKEIKAMSEEERLKALNAIWRNYTISDTYEPGSTFKPFTVSLGLEENIIHSNDTYFCDGYEEIGGIKIHCSKRTGHGELTLTQALMFSCNDALMQIVNKEGRNLFHKYQTFFGFGNKTGIDLPGEASGILVDEDKLNATELATSSFGQTFTTTMVQVASAYSSLVNGGYYYQPHVVKQIVNADGATILDNDKVLVKETVSTETSEFIKNAMYMTVQEGTAGGAKVPGYKVGGKTGTAQKYPRADHTYLVSFLGAVPADNPEIVIYVVIDEPQGVEKQADSSIATKFASSVLNEILPFLDIYPTEDTGDATTEESAPVLPSTGTVNETSENSTSDTIETESSVENEENSSNTIESDTESNNQDTTRSDSIETDTAEGDFDPDFIPDTAEDFIPETTEATTETGNTN